MQPESENATTTPFSSPKKRIAICLSGLVRTYRETYENFKTMILEPNQAHDIDIFISTWPIEHSNNSMEWTRREAWYGKKAIPFPENPIDYLDLQAKYRPVALTVERPILFNTEWYHPTPGINIQSLLSMTYKIYAADLLRRHHEFITGTPYDVVFRMRFDTIVPFPIALEALNLDVIKVPSMMQPRPYPQDWVNDKFAVGTRHNLALYSDWYLNFVAMVKRGIPVQPETLLAAHLQENGVRYEPWGSEMDLIRFM